MDWAEWAAAPGVARRLPPPVAAGHALGALDRLLASLPEGSGQPRDRAVHQEIVVLGTPVAVAAGDLGLLASLPGALLSGSASSVSLGDLLDRHAQSYLCGGLPCLHAGRERPPVIYRQRFIDDVMTAVRLLRPSAPGRADSRGS